jgi:hypothetical protein
VIIGLDFGEELHWLLVLGEWSNMIGYEVGCSPARVYTRAKTSPVGRTSSMNGKMTWLPTWLLFLLGEIVIRLD